MIWRISNPKSQQLRGRKPTPYTAQPLVSVIIVIIIIISKILGPEVGQKERCYITGLESV
jgi:hypothetical protein